MNALESMRQVWKEEYETNMREKKWGWPKLYAEEREEFDRLLAENEERLNQDRMKR